jgi:tetratricopeptide (TPR) repeat protein
MDGDYIERVKARPAGCRLPIWSIRLEMRSNQPLGTFLFLASLLVSMRAPSAGIEASGGQRPASQPASPIPILQFAEQLISQGRADEARKVLIGGLKTFPEEAAFWNFLGVADAQENHIQVAKKEFQRAIQKSPHYSGAYLNLAHLYQLEGVHNPQALAQAAGTYRKLLQFDPSNTEANFQYAFLAMLQGAFQESLKHLTELPADDQQKPRALLLFCADHAGLGQADLARDDVARINASANVATPDVFSIIPTLTKHHQEDLAIRLLESLRQSHPASAGVLEQLGTLYEQTNQLGQARKTLEARARIQPNAASLIELARVAYRQQDFRGALGYLAHARDLEPKNAGIHFFFGIVCVELDLHQEAYESLKKAVSLNPNNPYYNYALGAVCTQRQDGHEAISCFKKYCELKPEDPRGKLALAAAYYYSHDLDSAQSLLGTLEDNPATAAMADYYEGRIANDQGRWAEAEILLKRAIQDCPRYADAYAVLGSAYLHQKRFADAESALTQALQAQPENYLANLNLMILYQRTKDARAAAQIHRFGEIKKIREQRARLFLRSIRVVP